jgi:exonuclease VII large subunit
VLSRGFSYTMTAAGAVVTDAENLSAGDELVTRLAKGSVRSRVE